jgi:hypothetical protein
MHLFEYKPSHIYIHTKIIIKLSNYIYINLNAKIAADSLMYNRS